MAAEVYKFLDWQSVSVVCRATATLRRAYQPLALQFVKMLVRQAAGQVGQARVHLNETSLAHNLYKLWRRGICVLETCLTEMATVHGGIYWTMETQRHCLWQPRGGYVPRALRAAALLASPLAAFMELPLNWGLDPIYMYVFSAFGCKVGHLKTPPSTMFTSKSTFDL